MFCAKMLRLQQLYRTASLLAIITIYYNIAEGVASVWLGAADETLALFGFGLDSFVEVISGLGIWHMIRRMGSGDNPDLDPFEQRALRITGGAFYLLAGSLFLTAVISILQGHHPESTHWGMVVAVISIVTMWALTHYKLKVGRALSSQAILADAACTRTCMQLSLILLAASVGYELTGIGYLDSLGSIFIAILSIREGREAFQKASGLSCSCSAGCGG